MSDIIYGYPDNPGIKPPTGNPGMRAKNRVPYWALEVIDAPGAWLIPQSGGEQTVVIIDTGFSPNHQDLLPTKSDTEIELVGFFGSKTGHGTEVGGVIAAAHNTGHGRAGVCPGSRITPIRVDISWALIEYIKTLAGSGQYTVLGQAFQLANELATKGQFRVLSISKSVTLDTATAEDLARTHLLSPVDTFLGRGGILVVGGDNANDVLTSSCFPAAIRQVSTKKSSILVVGSIESSSVLSLWNGELGAQYPGQNDVDIYAPGADQEVLDYENPSGYKTSKGNSLAIPHVAGVAALLLRINPALNGEQVATVIRETAELQKNDNRGEPVRVVNAFAAALKVYNEHAPDCPLAGYRVSMPVDFNEGTLEVNGEPVPVSHAGLGQSFCRFTAPRDKEIHARLFKHPSLEPGGERVCYWEGSFADLLANAMPGSKESAWSHPAVDELRTVRLQGLALPVWYGGTQPHPVADAAIILKDRRREGTWSARTDSTGRCVVPFGEPGPYTLIVKDTGEGGARYEVDLQLEGTTIYTTDPNHPENPHLVLGDPAPRNRWRNGFAGRVLFDGQAAWKGGELEEARGTLTFRAQAKLLSPEIFLHHCYESLTGDEVSFEDRLTGGDGVATWEPMSAAECAADLSDMMPDLARPQIRVCSILYGNLANKPDSMWQHDFDAEEWWDGQEIPAGVVITTAGGECHVTIDIPDLTKRMLDAYFRGDIGMHIPYEFDVEFGFFLDHSEAQGPGARFFLQELGGVVTIADVPCRVDRYLSDDQQKYRIIAGPCENALRFVTHPDSQIRIEPDSQPAPAGCISAIVTETRDESDMRRYMNRIAAVGSQGEVGFLSQY